MTLVEGLIRGAVAGMSTKQKIALMKRMLPQALEATDNKELYQILSKMLPLLLKKSLSKLGPKERQKTLLLCNSLMKDLEKQFGKAK